MGNQIFQKFNYFHIWIRHSESDSGAQSEFNFRNEIRIRISLERHICTIFRCMQNPIFPKLSDFQNPWIPKLSEIQFIDFFSTFSPKHILNRMVNIWRKLNFWQFRVACKIRFFKNCQIFKILKFLNFLKSDSLFFP